MPDPTSSSGAPAVEFNRIDDPEVRRALRLLQTEFSGKLAQMQIQLDAMLQMMVDKHIGNLAEFRREVARLQQDHGRLERLHGAMSGGAPQTSAGPVIRSVPPGGVAR